MHLVALTALAMSSVFADDMGKGGSAGQMSMQRADSGMMNVSALPMIDSNNWNLFGDVLYWRALEGGTTWALNQSLEPSGTTNEHIRKVNFNWDWGFRVGIGGNLMMHDEWDMELYYTWFRTEKEDAVGVEGSLSPRGFATGGIITYFQQPPLVDGAPDGMQSGSIDWKIFFSMFDWALGRNFYVSKHLALRPHVGVKGGWIHQKIHGDWKVNSTYGTTGYSMKNDFWGVGPSAGLDSKWVLGNVGTHMFNLLGNVAGALMYGHFDLKSGWDNTHDNQLLTNMSRDLGATMMQGFMGFSWETNFNADRCHFTMMLGYELQYWFSQNQLFNTQSFDFQNDDLMLQGGTLDFRFDF